MMRITFVVPGLESSGGARIIAGHAERLAERGHEVLIVAPRPRIPTLKERAKALLGRGALPGRLEHSHYERIQVPIRIMGNEGPLMPEDVPDADVIIATFWTTAEWIWPLPRQKGAKVHFLQHYEIFPGLPADRVDDVWRLSTHKIAVAQWLVDLGRDRFGLENIALVPNSIDHQFFNAKQRARRGTPTVGFLFSEASFKDVPTSLAALKVLKEIKPETNILSFGAARPSARQLPTGSEFYYLPSQQQIAGIYSRCDAWLSTSRTEGFNLPPIEAMATGCPAVCAKTGRPLEIIKSGVNGFLVDQGDVCGFADALVAILDFSDDAWLRMSDAAVRAVAHPTWEESTALFEGALIRAMDASRPSDGRGKVKLRV